MGKPTKHCSRCQTDKDYSEFNTQKDKKDGLRANCKACLKTYRDKNKHKIKSYADSYRLVNKERINANADIYRKKYRHKIARRQRLYAQTHPEIQKNWVRANPEKRFQYDNKRRLKMKQNGIFIVLESEIKKLQKGKCFYCGSNDRITIDHIIPIMRGGRHSIGNLVTACKSCNSKKGTKTIMEWRMYQNATVRL